MIIGAVKEIKNAEHRVALTPAGASMLTGQGHRVIVEKDCGIGSGFTDEDYAAAGAAIVSTAEEAWGAELVLKVKEPLPEEYRYMREGLQLFTYLHLASDKPLLDALLENKVTAIAYETVQLGNGALPLLTPMSEVAGRMAVQIGAGLLEKPKGGQGVLLGGVPGVEPAEVVIVGGGVVGMNACKIAVGMGASVTLLDINAERLRQLDNQFGGAVKTVISNPYNVEKAVRKADLVIGAVLIPGARAPRLVTEPMVQAMKKGSVIVDVAIDQGGSIATMDRITSHDNPTFVKHDVVHYSVPNIPGAVPRTSTLALTNVTLPYVLQLANKGVIGAAMADEAIAKGFNAYAGQVTNQPVASTFGLPCASLKDLVTQTA